MFLLALNRVSNAAPCCAASGAFPSLLASDDRAQVSLSLAGAGVVADAPVAGGLVQRASNDDETRGTARVDLATLVSDRWQVGASLALVRRTRDLAGEALSSSGLGDTAATIAFEALPEWSYSAWRPRGYVFAQLILPTAASIQDSRASFGMDSRGRGFLQPAVGILLIKQKGDFDFAWLAEMHHPLPRSFDTPAGRLRYAPGLGYGTSLSAGWSPAGGALRLGAILSLAKEEGQSVTGDLPTELPGQSSLTPQFQAGYLLAEGWTAVASYSDGTWLGGNRNVPVTRSLGVLLQHRWER